MIHGESERSVETLIKLAGERDAPSAEGMRRARLAAEQSWRRALAQEPSARPSRRHWLARLGIALAAGIAAIAFFVGPRLMSPSTLPPLGQVVVLDGMAQLHHGGSQRPIAVGDSLSAGATLIASQGRVAISLGNAMSLRLNQGAHLRFEGHDRVTLVEGVLYVDSGGVNQVSGLRISTPAGEVRHVGTQFLVSVSRDVTRVRVREGRVRLVPQEKDQPMDLTHGDEIEYRDGQTHWRHDLPSFGNDWQWTTNVAPMFDAENRPMSEFLEWLVREQGWQLHYTSEAVQQRVQDIRLHGSFERLDAVAILERLIVVTGVPLSVRDGVLWVGSTS